MTMPNQPYRRIAVLGSSGSGKSALARALGVATGLPVIHLDKEHWQPGWTEPTPADWEAALASLADRPAWIIDGQYGASLAKRLARADLAIWLDLPTLTCLCRVIKRTIATHGRVRVDMGAGCPERFNREFLHYVATFRRHQRPWLAATLAASLAPVVHLTSARGQSEFSATLEQSGLTAAVAGTTYFLARSS